MKRIIFHHAQKVGGRSTSQAILVAICEKAGANKEEAETLSALVRAGTTNAALAAPGGIPLNGPHSALYASHTHPPPPVRPDDRFHLFQMREPMARLVSHYRMCAAGDRDRPWDDNVGRRPESFMDFLKHAPPALLMRQLHSLDLGLNPDAAMKALERMDHVIFLDRYAEGIAELARKTGLPLRPYRVGSSINFQESANSVLQDAEALEFARKIAAPEFELWKRVLDWRDK